MKRTRASAADSMEPGEKVKEKEQAEDLQVSFDKIEDRASTKTKLMAHLLEEPEGHYLRNWGLNE